MKMIKLYAYLCHNLGDDLMVDILSKRYPDVRFYCDGYRYAQLNYRYPNVCAKEVYRLKYGRLNHILNILTFYRKRNWFLNWVFRCLDSKVVASVLIGGSLFMEDADESAEERVAREELRIKSLPMFIIGANFGPYESKKFASAFCNFFGKCKSVTFRDKASYTLFSGLGNVHYAPDVVFNLETSSYCPINNISNTIVISVIDATNRAALKKYAENYEMFIINLCNEIVAAGKKPVLMSFCKEEGDENAINRILISLSPAVLKETQVHFYAGNIQQALCEFAACEKVIATRFHSMILAFCFGKPCFTLAYNSKVTNVLDDMKNKNYCAFPDISKLNAAEVLSATNKVQDIAEVILKAKQQFKDLDYFIHKKYVEKSLE